MTRYQQGTNTTIMQGEGVTAEQMSAFAQEMALHNGNLEAASRTRLQNSTQASRQTQNAYKETLQKLDELVVGAKGYFEHEQTRIVQAPLQEKGQGLGGRTTDKTGNLVIILDEEIAGGIAGREYEEFRKYNKHKKTLPTQKDLAINVIAHELAHKLADELIIPRMRGAVDELTTSEAIAYFIGNEASGYKTPFEVLQNVPNKTEFLKQYQELLVHKEKHGAKQTIKHAARILSRTK